jgi:hypothetical protein
MIRGFESVRLKLFHTVQEQYGKKPPSTSVISIQMESQDHQEVQEPMMYIKWWLFSSLFYYLESI